MTHAVANIASAQKDRSQEVLNVAKALNDIKYNFNILAELIKKIDNSIPNNGVVYENENSIR